jgi:hypothetical protein
LTAADACRAFHIQFIPSGLCLLSLRLLLIGLVNDDTSDYIIDCNAFSPFLQTVYHPTLEANISINLTNYDGATSLDLRVFCSMLSRNSINYIM